MNLSLSGMKFLHYVFEKTQKRQLHLRNLKQSWSWMDMNCTFYPSSSLLEKKMHLVYLARRKASGEKLWYHWSSPRAGGLCYFSQKKLIYRKGLKLTGCSEKQRNHGHSRNSNAQKLNDLQNNITMELKYTKTNYLEQLRERKQNEC